MTVQHKYVYLFADGVAEGQAAWRDLLGGKGAGLAEMTALGIRVPPGCTISTEDCWGDVWGPAAATALIRALRRTRIHAWDDGHSFEHRPQ